MNIYCDVYSADTGVNCLYRNDVSISLFRARGHFNHCNVRKLYFSWRVGIHGAMDGRIITRRPLCSVSIEMQNSDKHFLFESVFSDAHGSEVPAESFQWMQCNFQLMMNVPEVKLSPLFVFSLSQYCTTVMSPEAMMAFAFFIFYVYKLTIF